MEALLAGPGRPRSLSTFQHYPSRIKYWAPRGASASLPVLAPPAPAAVEERDARPRADGHQRIRERARERGEEGSQRPQREARPDRELRLDGSEDALVHEAGADRVSDAHGARGGAARAAAARACGVAAPRGRGRRAHPVAPLEHDLGGVAE